MASTVLTAQQYNDKLEGFTQGDFKPVIRYLTLIPEGITFTKAWLTVKTRYSDTDANALAQKVITSVYEQGQGEIFDEDPDDGMVELRFELMPAETILFSTDKQSPNYFDIQVLVESSPDGLPVTQFRGPLWVFKEVTRATS